MCQAKDKGGKRCAAHMSGSLATVSMSSIMTRLKETFVRKVFSELNKEGKKLPTPSEEEIIAFARNNQFIARHDITIPDNKRAMLVKRWQKAEEERPTGGTFHAWKHTTVESIVRWKRASAATALLVGVSFSTACSGGAISNDATPEDTSSPTSISQSATPSPSVEPTIEASHAPSAGEVVETPKGSYLKSTVKDDDPALKYNPEIVDPSATQFYTPEEIAEGQKAIVTFMAEEGIDSSYNGKAVSADAWWEENKGNFHPDFHDEFKASLNKEDASVVLSNSWVEKTYGPNAKTEEGKKLSYEYVYNPDQTRVVNRKITPNLVYATPEGYLVVESNVSYGMRTVPGPRVEGYESNGIQETNGTMTYAASKDPATGKWLINGYFHKVKTFQG